MSRTSPAASLGLDLLVALCGARRPRARSRSAARTSLAPACSSPCVAPESDRTVADGWCKVGGFSPAAISAGSGCSDAVPDGRIDVAVGVVLQQIPDRRALGVLERDLALRRGGVEQERDHRVLADVLGDVLLRVVGPHLLLVDVLLEDVAEHIGVDLVVGAQRALVEMPLVLVEEVEDALEGSSGI